tara:strand:+ start:368 stop:664 length:297 start_codon:yes stop_codon:yes gene_type:complete
MNNKMKLQEQSIKEPIRLIPGKNINHKYTNSGYIKKVYQYKGFLFYVCPIFKEYTSFEGQAIGDVWGADRKTIKKKVDMRIEQALKFWSVRYDYEPKR